MRQKFKGGFIENGAFYIFDTLKYLNTGIGFWKNRDI